MALNRSKLKATELAFVDTNNIEYIVHDFERQGLVARTKDQLKSALSKLGSNNGTICIVDSINVDEDLTIPENISLKFFNGGILNVLTQDIPDEDVGTGDGSTTEFSLAYPPVLENSETIYVDGTEQTRNTDYTINYETGVITFTSAPADGASITADYTRRFKLTINGGIDAGLFQIFDGDGFVTGNPKIEAVYPEWFGAKGDGVTDDTKALQKAVDFSYVNDVSYTLQNIPNTILSKEYDLEGQLLLRDGVTIRALNKYQGRILYYAETDGEIKIKQDGQNCELINLSFFPNYNKTPFSVTCTLIEQNYPELRIEGCRFSASTFGQLGDGGSIWEGVTGVKINTADSCVRDCNFDGIEVPIEIRGNHNQVFNVYGYKTRHIIKFIGASRNMVTGVKFVPERVFSSGSNVGLYFDSSSSENVVVNYVAKGDYLHKDIEDNGIDNIIIGINSLSNHSTYSNKIFDTKILADLYHVNFCKNGDFLLWSNGTSSAPDHFSLTNATISRASEGHSIITTDGSDVSDFKQKNLYVYELAKQNNLFVTVVADVKADNDEVRLTILDGVGATSADRHSGSGDWERLKISKQYDGSETTFEISIRVPSGVATTYEVRNMRIFIGETSNFYQDYDTPINNTLEIYSFDNKGTKEFYRGLRAEIGEADPNATVTFRHSFSKILFHYPEDISDVTGNGFTMNASGGKWMVIGI